MLNKSALKDFEQLFVSHPISRIRCCTEGACTIFVIGLVRSAKTCQSLKICLGSGCASRRLVLDMDDMVSEIDVSVDPRYRLRMKLRQAGPSSGSSGCCMDLEPNSPWLAKYQRLTCAILSGFAGRREAVELIHLSINDNASDLGAAFVGRSSLSGSTPCCSNSRSRCLIRCRNSASARRFVCL